MRNRRNSMPRRLLLFDHSSTWWIIGKKIDERRLAIYTKAQFSFFPYMVPTMLMVSPTQWEKAGRSWSEFGKSPAGTGPFKITSVKIPKYQYVGFDLSL